MNYIKVISIIIVGLFLSNCSSSYDEALVKQRNEMLDKQRIENNYNLQYIKGIDTVFKNSIKSINNYINRPSENHINPMMLFDSLNFSQLNLETQNNIIETLDYNNITYDITPTEVGVNSAWPSRYGVVTFDFIDNSSENNGCFELYISFIRAPRSGHTFTYFLNRNKSTYYILPTVGEWLH